MKILITGASGFIGQHLCSSLEEQGYDVRSAVRQSSTKQLTPDSVIIDDIGPETDWTKALDSVDIVIHLAGCAHQVSSLTTKNHDKFDRVNHQGTHHLAIQAAKQRVKCFIFLSSIKVYGENIPTDTILTENSEVGSYCDAYGLSKLAAEQRLKNVTDNSTMNFVIIRSPLVYGPGVAANFRSLVKLAATGMPLPFLSINNRRSMIAIENLINFISCCLKRKEASNQIYLISDGDDLSLPRLIQIIRSAMSLPTRLFKFPLSILKILAFLLGKSRQFDKLTNSIQLDTKKAKQQLGWTPVTKVENSILITVLDYIETK